MIRRIEALNYRCLRYVSQDVAPFQILVGANASGKSTFLDVVQFLSDLLSEGLDRAVERRTTHLSDLCWRHRAGGFQLAVEMAIPDELRAPPAQRGYDACRYEVHVGSLESSGEGAILAEQLRLLRPRPVVAHGPTQSESAEVRPSTILTGQRRPGRYVTKKTKDGKHSFQPETEAEKRKRWSQSYTLGPKNSALAFLPEDVTEFPVAVWFKRALRDAVHSVALNTVAMREPRAHDGVAAAWRL